MKKTRVYSIPYPLCYFLLNNGIGNREENRGSRIAREENEKIHDKSKDMRDHKL